MSSVTATTSTPQTHVAPNTPAADNPAAHVPSSLAEAKALVRARRQSAAPAAKAEEAAAPASATPSAEVKPGEAAPAAAAEGKEKESDERVARAFRQIQQRAKEVENAKKAFEDEKKSHAAKLAAAEKIAEQAALFEKDPVEWMQKYGGKDAYNRLTEWRLNGDKQPVDERISAAEQRAIAAEKAVEDERKAREEEKKAAEQQALKANVERQIADYKATFAPEYTPQERTTAKLFGIVDLEQASVDYAREEMARLRESGLEGAAIDQELTAPKIAVKVKAILEQQLSELRGNEVLKGIFGGATAPADPTPKQPPKPGPKQQQAPSLNNTMSATTDVGLGELSLAERKRIVHQRNRRR